MIQCSVCSFNMEEIKVIGPVLFAEGVVTIGAEDGMITAVSPLYAVHTIKIGEELKNPALQLICSSCGHQGSRDDFHIVASCIFTGKPTSFYVETFTGRYPVLEVHRNDAIRVFSEENSSWISPIFEEDMV